MLEEGPLRGGNLCGLWALKFWKWELASKRMRVQWRHELSDQCSFAALWDQRSLWCYLEAGLVCRQAGRQLVLRGGLKRSWHPGWGAG